MYRENFTFFYIEEKKLSFFMCAIMLYGYIQNGFSLVVVVVVVVSHNTWLWNEKKNSKEKPKERETF